MPRRLSFGLVFLLSILLLAGVATIGCGGGEEDATPTPGGTVAPAATPTDTPAAEATDTPAAAASPTPSPGGEEISVTIVDFQFNPASVTVNVGDTVTWTNDGPSPHTATADDGSFDSGNLSTGQTFSHTFTTAGTFSYICTVHPFMKAQVVVQ